MGGFADKFKFIVEQAQQKVTHLQDNGQLKEIVDQIKEKVTEYSELAQTKLEEYRANSERQRFESAAADASNHQYQKAVNTLKAIPASSELYKEAQQKISDYVNASCEYVLQQAEQISEQGFYNEAIKSLKTIPEESIFHQQAQEKISQYKNTIETLIKKHKNIIPITYGDRIVAAAFIDKTIHSVTEIERTNFIYNSFENTYADGEFIIIRLLVKNDEKKARTISASMMKIIDSQEREYTVSSEGAAALRMRDQSVEFGFSEIQPGLQKTITIIFDLPSEATNLSLKVSSGSWGGEAILPLSLAI